MVTDRISTVAAELSGDLTNAMMMMRAAGSGFTALHSKLDSGAVDCEEAERLEAKIDQARSLLLGVLASTDELRANVRRSLVEAGSPRWSVIDGGIIQNERT